MNASPNNSGEGGGGKSIGLVAILTIAILSVLYFLKKSKPTSGDGDGGDGGDSGSTPPKGAQSQSQVTPGRPDDAYVDLDPNAVFNKAWVSVIDMMGAMLIDKLEEKFKADEERKARAEDERARADAEAKARADERARLEAEERARVDADKARADAADKARADAQNAVREETGKAEGDAKAAAEEKAVKSADDSVRVGEAGDPPRGGGDGLDSHPLEFTDEERAKLLREADEEARMAEEEYARSDANEKAIRGDAESRSTDVKSGRDTIRGEVTKAEARARGTAEAALHADDVTNDLRGEMDRSRTSIEASAHEKTMTEATKQDVADSNARQGAANADASQTARSEIKVASEEAISSKEKKAVNAAETDANTTRQGKKPWGKRMAEHFGRGRIGSSQIRSWTESKGEPTRNAADGRIESSNFKDGPHDGSAHGATGDVPSQERMRTREARRWLGESVSKEMQMKKKTPAGHSTSNMVDSKIGGKTGGKTAASIAKKGARALIGALNKLNIASDIMMVFQIFADSFFHGAFPDESTLITTQSIANILKKSIQKQIDLTTEYNENIDRTNAGLVDYKWPRAQWPVIMGPLDIPTLHGHARGMKYPEYEQQVRVQIEIDSVREQLLRKPGPFKDAWISAFSVSDYDAVIIDPDDSLVDYVDGNFNAATSDELYRQAFRNVCAYFDGVMYEDVRPASDPHWGGRPRFQCGWKNPGTCEAAANQWLSTNGNYGGQYAEWYTFDELNQAMQGITVAPSKSITACSGTGTGYASMCEIRNGATSATGTAGSIHPLRRSGKNGMCVVSSAGVAAVCNGNGGSYDVATHSCVFSPEYCQSIGTCFDNTSKMCYLPGEAMFAVSMVFGTGGPREWIKVNGCNFTSSPQKTFENIINTTPLGLFTAQGQTFFADMVKNQGNWGEGLEATLGNPVMAAMIASMVVAEVAAPVIAGLLAGGTASAAQTGGVSIVIMAIAIGLAMGVMTLQGNEAENKGPPDPQYGPFGSEYTVGGWRDGIGTSPPMTLGFNRGWVTKPLPAHQLTNWPPTALTHVVDGVTVNTPAMPPGFSHVRDMSLANVEQIEFYADSSLGLAGAWTGSHPDMAMAVTTYTQTHEPQVRKNLCYMKNKIRSGADSSNNKAWCMDPFPPATYADTVNIGTLAPDPTTTNTDGTTTASEPGASRSYSTSRSWTNGANPYFAQYPFGPAENPYYVLNGNEPGAWFYQLVYDKNTMVGMTESTTTDGVKIKVGYPTHLWNNDLLRFYFLDTTIQEMRQYYCIQALGFYPDGQVYNPADGTGVHEKCWGYLDIEIPGYKYMPMTIPGEMMSSANPTFTQQATCRSGYALNYATNTCLPTAAELERIATAAQQSAVLNQGNVSGPNAGNVAGGR